MNYPHPARRPARRRNVIHCVIEDLPAGRIENKRFLMLVVARPAPYKYFIAAFLESSDRCILPILLLKMTPPYRALYTDELYLVCSFFQHNDLKTGFFG